MGVHVENQAVMGDAVQQFDGLKQHEATYMRPQWGCPSADDSS